MEPPVRSVLLGQAGHEARARGTAKRYEAGRTGYAAGPPGVRVVLGPRRWVAPAVAVGGEPGSATGEEHRRPAASLRLSACISACISACVSACSPARMMSMTHNRKGHAA